MDLVDDFIRPEQAGSLAQLLCRRIRQTPEKIAYRWYDREAGAWRKITWDGVGAEVGRWQAALRRDGLVCGNRVAIMASNSPLWVFLDQAALGLGLVVVPVYYSDRGENVRWILERTDTRLLFIDDPAHWRRIGRDLDGLALRVVLGGADTGGGDGRHLALSRWLPAAGDGRAPPIAARDDVATIVHTSGTAGRPKGVELTHESILWNAGASHRCNPVHSDDLFLSFLPLSHMLERTIGYYLPMMAGATVAFARSATQLPEDLRTVAPTVIISVPRVYERMHARIDEALARAPAWRRALLELTVATGWAQFRNAQGQAVWQPRQLLWPVLRRLVSDRVLAMLGGRLRIAVCGGAPLPPRIARRFIGLGLPLVQGYGMTELSPVVSGNRLADNDPESVGRPLEDVEVRIGSGDEVLVRSPGVMRAYLDDRAATEAAFSKGGWLRTGDCGRLVGGRLYITGRIKDVIVLSNGEKVSPADLEAAITLHPLIDQAVVIGEGRPFLSALLVLNLGQWAESVREHGLGESPAEALGDRRARDLVRRIVAGQTSAFPGYARIRRVGLSLEPWTIDNGLLTPTMKVRRGEVVARFGCVVAEMYAGH